MNFYSDYNVFLDVDNQIRVDSNFPKERDFEWKSQAKGTLGQIDHFLASTKSILGVSESSDFDDEDWSDQTDDLIDKA